MWFSCASVQHPDIDVRITNSDISILQLTLGLAVMFSGMMGSAGTPDSTSSTAAIASTTAPIVSSSSSAQAVSRDNEGSANNSANINNKNLGLEAKVKAFTSDKPLMAEIAYCESRNRQYEKDGSILRGIVNNKDVGLFQINEYYHLERAKKLGYDIYSPEGNMAYARVIFDEQGAAPWSSSAPCWSKTAAYQAYKQAKSVVALK